MTSYYIAAHIPKFVFDGDHSGHATIAFEKQDMVKYNKYVGSIVKIAVSDYLVRHVVDGLDYAYRDVRIELMDDEAYTLIKIDTHTSVTVKDGGIKYKNNRFHQRDNKKEFNITNKWAIFSTILTPYSHKKQMPNVTIDLDNTLIDIHVHENKIQDKIAQNPRYNFLLDDTLITKEALTPFGKLIIALEIPFIILTSRHYVGNELTTKIMSLFPKCIGVSYGKHISPQSTDKNKEKALDKLKRLPLFAIHFDDEEIVAKTLHGRKVWFENNKIFTKSFLTTESQTESRNNVFFSKLRKTRKQ